MSFEEVALPTLTGDEVLVEVRAVSINPSDVAMVAGAFKSPLPRTPGRDFAGVVVGGNQWKGKEVWGSGAGFGASREGAHAQFLAIPAAWLSEKPSELSMEEASAVGIPFLAAWEALIRMADIVEGETILITGAGGSVGRAATQIARWKNATVIGVGHSDQSTSADTFINLDSKNLCEEVLKLTQGQGVDVVLDAVGGTFFEPCLGSLRIGGRQIVMAGAPTPPVTFNLADFYHKRSRLLGMDTMKLTGQEVAEILINFMLVSRRGIFGHRKSMLGTSTKLLRDIRGWRIIAFTKSRS